MARACGSRGRRRIAALVAQRLCIRQPMAGTHPRDHPPRSARRAVVSRRYDRATRPDEPGLGRSDTVSPAQHRAWSGATHRRHARERPIAPAFAQGAARRQASRWPGTAARCAKRVGDERHRLLAVVLATRPRRPLDRPRRSRRSMRVHLPADDAPAWYSRRGSEARLRRLSLPVVQHVDGVLTDGYDAADEPDEAVDDVRGVRLAPDPRARRCPGGEYPRLTSV